MIVGATIRHANLRHVGMAVGPLVLLMDEPQLEIAVGSMLQHHLECVGALGIGALTGPHAQPGDGDPPGARVQIPIDVVGAGGGTRGDVDIGPERRDGRIGQGLDRLRGIDGDGAAKGRQAIDIDIYSGMVGAEVIDACAPNAEVMFTRMAPSS